MSVSGTGVAAGVAQTGLQAQQVARERDRRVADQREEARRLRERFEAALRAVEEGDAAGLSTHLDVSDELPDPPTPLYYPPEEKSVAAPVPQAAADDERAEPDEPPTGRRSPLYRHVDVQA